MASIQRVSPSSDRGSSQCACSILPSSVRYPVVPPLPSIAVATMTTPLDASRLRELHKCCVGTQRQRVVRCVGPLGDGRFVQPAVKRLSDVLGQPMDRVRPAHCSRRGRIGRVTPPAFIDATCVHMASTARHAQGQRESRWTKSTRPAISREWPSRRPGHLGRTRTARRKGRGRCDRSRDPRPADRKCSEAGASPASIRGSNDSKSRRRRLHPGRPACRARCGPLPATWAGGRRTIAPASSSPPSGLRSRLALPAWNACCSRTTVSGRRMRSPTCTASVLHGHAVLCEVSRVARPQTEPLMRTVYTGRSHSRTVTDLALAEDSELFLVIAPIWLRAKV